MEYIVSARKYRPMTFDSVVGQSALTTTLKNAVKSGKLAHAYLFCGPRGVGKTTCARIFAKAINCEHPTSDGEACNECESCKAFNEQRSYNIFELDAASNNSVENIKSLMDQTRIPPQVGKYKVFIIDEVHMLSAAAFNAFLKTLEEPPAHVIFILATTEKHKILPTILSRCQIYDFERMSVPDIINHLKMVAEREGYTYEEEALAIIAEKADGGMRDALSIFDQTASFSQGNVTYQKVIDDLNVLDSENYFNIVNLALENKAAEIMVLLNDIINKGFDGGQLVNGLASHIRNVLMAKDPQTLPLLEVSQQQRERFQQQAAKCPTPFLYRALQIANQCDINYRTSSNKRLLVELTLIQIAQVTQPDDDTPSAGRSPKRLKFLFRKLVSKVQPKPVAQVTGAERRTTKVEHQEPKENLSPKKKPTISLGTIGMSFNRLLNEENAKPSYYKEPEIENKNEKSDFTEEELMLQWRSMCNRMAQQDKLRGMASRMKNLNPVITEYPNIEVIVESKMLLDEMNEVRNRIRVTLAHNLHNSDINFNIRLAEQEEIKPQMSRREILTHLQQENAAVNRLTTALGLELA
jgi:DNA polymerase-3 subunit gamma/tau